MTEGKLTEQRVQMGAVTLYPNHWATIKAFAKDMGYPSTSSALRRVIDEWLSMRRERVELSRDENCIEEAYATREMPHA